jgi:hypothetical protein
VNLWTSQKGITARRIEEEVIKLVRDETDKAAKNVESNLGSECYYHHAVGIAFAHLGVKSQYESRMTRDIEDFLFKIESCLHEWTAREPYVVLEGRYYPPYLRKPERFYEWFPGSPKCLYPGLTILICENVKRR